MSVTGTQIRVGRAPTATRAFVLAALLVTAVWAGFVAGRATVSTTATDRPATIESTISTTWLAGTPAVRAEVMQKMNSLTAIVGRVQTASTGRAVMRHMNELAPASSAPSTESTALSVMRHMNELARRG